MKVFARCTAQRLGLRWIFSACGWVFAQLSLKIILQGIQVITVTTESTISIIVICLCTEKPFCLFLSEFVLPFIEWAEAELVFRKSSLITSVYIIRIIAAGTVVPTIISSFWRSNVNRAQALCLRRLCVEFLQRITVSDVSKVHPNPPNPHTIAVKVIFIFLV